MSQVSRCSRAIAVFSWRSCITPSALKQVRHLGHQACSFLLLMFLGALILLGVAAPVWANNEVPSPPDVIQPLPPATNPQAEDISFEKVSQFVQAYLQVLALLDRREGDLQAAETELESLRLQQEVEVEAFHLIEASGLTLQEYLQLLGLANTDPEFGERVATLLQEIPLD
jgi:hypothetical protein